MEMLPDFTILDLPPCVLLHIYSFLNPEDVLSMRKISQLLYHISYNDSLWKTLDTRKCGDDFVTDGSFCSLLHDVETIIECLHFDIRFFRVLEYLSEADDLYCPNLREIYIYNDTMRGEFEDIYRSLGLDEKMIKLSQKYKKLTTLVYDNLFINTDAVFSSLEKFECWCYSSTVDGPTQLKKFLRKHPQLKHLRLQLIYCNDEDIFSSLFTDFPGLVTLDVCGILSEELNPWLQQTYHLSHLQELSINDLPEIEDETIEIIVKNASDLRTFRVWYCHKLTDITLKCLAEYCPKLEIFEIGGHDINYTDAGLLSVAINCTKLKEVKMTPSLNSNDLTFRSFVLNCPALSSFKIEGASTLTDSTVLAMIERCSNMQRLDFSSCRNLTAISISSVLRYYKHLDFLRIANNKALTTFTLVEPKSDEGAKKKKLDKSEENSNVNWNVCIEETNEHSRNESSDEQGKESKEQVENTTDQEEKVKEKGEETKDYGEKTRAIMPVTQTIKKTSQSVERWSALKTLDMSGCVAITDNCLYSIVCYCSNLRELNLSGCKNLTDTTVSELVKRCKFLKTLKISAEEDTICIEDESELTDGCLVDIAMYGNNIEVLEMKNCNNFTSQGIYEFPCHFLCCNANNGIPRHIM
ncbi:F-box/LRR-repeat protein 7-like [Mercenaria mercenaria]|uniref:F-box/LRR-repeat protein 7-like n=1 Tax=Mercenaria mercenaria TaxID=6596 RepID=UPI00234E8AF7|nr:F-box/LRR-repeat protein 7-like [Mercenaria mercenaria]